MTASAESFTLSSMPPMAAFFGAQPVTLLVGVEDGPDGTLKAYLGARYKGIYVLVVDPEEQETVRRAWGSGGHIWWSPVPSQELLHKDPS